MTTTFHLIPLVIAGPTASGKSSIALDLAERNDAEIICADSRQLYRGMAIGTACPTDDERARVVHHGYGSIDPAHEKMDAGAFVNFAQRMIHDVTARKKRPILVGGTGLYLRSLYYGLGDVPKTDASITDELYARALREGVAPLFQELAALDPDSVLTIKSTDTYRIVRALEIYAVTGRKPSTVRQSFKEGTSKLRAHWVYKKPDRAALIKRIEDRVAAMFDHGLIDEAKELRARLPQNHWALSVMGYDEALQVLDGKMSLEDAKIKTAIRHRQYAKRQFTWFNKESFYRFVIS